MKLNTIRKQIDLIDSRILILVDRRFKLAKKAKLEKDKLGLKIADKKREQEILNKLSKKASKLNLEIKFITDLYKRILRESKRIQKSYD